MSSSRTAASLLSHLPFQQQSPTQTHQQPQQHHQLQKHARFSNKGGSGSGSGSGKNKEKKENFAKKFLEPAARGELSKHKSGIPKLAARQRKGHSIKDNFPGKESQDIMSDAMRSSGGGRGGGRGGMPRNRNNDKNNRNGNQNRRRGPQGRGPGGNRLKPQEQPAKKIFETVQPSDLDPTIHKKEIQWLGSEQSNEQTRFQQQRNLKTGRSQNMSWDPFQDYVDEDGWETDTMTFTYHTPHPESKREAKPITFPSNRINPPSDFIQTHEAFAYVANVPHPVVDGELGSFDDPLHRHQVAEFVADAFGVPATQVFCANMTSAFVGFQSSQEADEAYYKHEAKRIITSEKIDMQVYKSNEGESETDAVKEFISGAEDGAVVQINHVPAAMRPDALASILYPAVSSMNISNLGTSDILYTHPTTPLLRLSSAKDAQSLLHNSRAQKALAMLQRQILRVLPAKREVVHDKFKGPLKSFQMKKMTDKLIVEGDLPTKDFFLSHGMVLHLSYVPIGVTKKEISSQFQKYCNEQRDIEGSIQFVTSADGHPTGRAYVGFDLEAEGMVAWRDIFDNAGQQMRFGSHPVGPSSRVRPVKEYPLLRGAKLGERSERTQEELVASFTAWKDDIDPKDIEELESYGVTMDVLDEAFRAARHNNPTFGVEDQARMGERLRDEYAPGEHFKEFVQMYVDSLKEVGTTREDPGLKYKAMFLEDEELDLSIFDVEEERLANLREK